MADLTTARRASMGNLGLHYPRPIKTTIHHSLRWNVMQHTRACVPLLHWAGLMPVEKSHTPPIPSMLDRVYRHATVAVADTAIKRTRCRSIDPLE